MSLLLNLIWIVFGGFLVFLGYLTGGLALCCTLIGIPWGIQCFKLSILALFPFGSEVTSSAPDSFPSDPLNLLMNIIWLIFGGLWVVFNHLVWGVIFSLTIIGIPFGLQHFKLMKLAFTPFGRRITDA